MQLLSLLFATVVAPYVNAAGATLRFSCSQLVVERLDPFVSSFLAHTTY